MKETDLSCKNKKAHALEINLMHGLKIYLAKICFEILLMKVSTMLSNTIYK